MRDFETVQVSKGKRADFRRHRHAVLDLLGVHDVQQASGVAHEGELERGAHLERAVRIAREVICDAPV